MPNNILADDVLHDSYSDLGLFLAMNAEQAALNGATKAVVKATVSTHNLK